MKILDTHKAQFGLDVAIGALEGIQGVRISGKNAGITTSMADLWPQNIVRTLPAVASPVKFGVSSGSANDAAAGTGARTVTLYMLTATYEAAVETLSLNGQTKVETTGTYIRLQKAEVVTAGSGGVNAGILYVYDTSDTVAAGVPQTATKIFGHIAIGDNVTQQAMITVPLNKTYLVRKIFLGQYDTAARYNRFQYAIQAPGGLWLYYPLAALVTAASTVIERAFDMPIVLPEKYEFKLQGIGSAAGSIAMAEVEIIAVNGVVS